MLETVYTRKHTIVVGKILGDKNCLLCTLTHQYYATRTKGEHSIRTKALNKTHRILGTIKHYLQTSRMSRKLLHCAIVLYRNQQDMESSPTTEHRDNRKDVSSESTHKNYPKKFR